MLVKVFGAAVQGISATIITIEVNISKGIKFFLVGLPDNAVKESHERIISATIQQHKNSSYTSCYQYGSCTNEFFFIKAVRCSR